MRITIHPDVIRATNACERDQICALAVSRHRSYPWYMARCSIHGERVGLLLEFGEFRGFREVLGRQSWCCGAFERQTRSQQTRAGQPDDWQGYLAWLGDWPRLRAINQGFLGTATAEWFHTLPMRMLEGWIQESVSQRRARQVVALLIEWLLAGRRSPSVLAVLEVARKLGAGGPFEGQLRPLWRALIREVDFGSRVRYSAAQAVRGFLDGHRRTDVVHALRELGHVFPALAAQVQDAAGPPFPAPACRAEWRSPAVLAVTESVVRDAQYELIPVLGDALEEAGGPEIAVRHCREASVHTHGCWLLDWVRSGPSVSRGVGPLPRVAAPGRSR